MSNCIIIMMNFIVKLNFGETAMDSPSYWKRHINLSFNEQLIQSNLDISIVSVEAVVIEPIELGNTFNFEEYKVEVINC